MFRNSLLVKTLCVSVIVFLSLAVTHAQKSAQDPKSTSNDPPSQDQKKEQGPVVKERTDVVTLSVTVTDPFNRLVTGLDRHHFEIFEDKVKQQIEFFRLNCVDYFRWFTGRRNVVIPAPRAAHSLGIQNSRDQNVASPKIVEQPSV